MATLPEGTADAFNRWMRDYIDNPDKYRQIWQDVVEFIGTPPGAKPDYGRACVVVLERYLSIAETTRDSVPASLPPDGGG